MGELVALECSNCEVEMEEVLGAGLAISRQIYSCMPCRVLTLMAIGVEHSTVSDFPEDDYLDCVGCGEPMLPLWPPPPGHDVVGRCPVCRAGELTLVSHLTAGGATNHAVAVVDPTCPAQLHTVENPSLLDSVQL